MCYSAKGQRWFGSGRAFALERGRAHCPSGNGGDKATKGAGMWEGCGVEVVEGEAALIRNEDNAGCR